MRQVCVRANRWRASGPEGTELGKDDGDAAANGLCAAEGGGFAEIEAFLAVFGDPGKHLGTKRGEGGAGFAQMEGEGR